ncbi:hypothetical protein, partial [Paenibacillus xylanexedens]|uniref:hypothetical protein n=1 Tax=Paenibacillus xylanexedens TaxID=528191 RepID=UPI001C92C040
IWMDDEGSFIRGRLIYGWFSKVWWVWNFLNGKGWKWVVEKELIGWRENWILCLEIRRAWCVGSDWVWWWVDCRYMIVEILVY